MLSGVPRAFEGRGEPREQPPLTRTRKRTPNRPPPPAEPPEDNVPEGHTIHRLAEDSLAHFGGGKNADVTSPQGKFADAAALLTGTPSPPPRHTENTSSCTSATRTPRNGCTSTWASSAR